MRQIKTTRLKQIIEEVASLAGISEDTARLVVNTTIDEMVRSLRTGKNVYIRGFGTLKVKDLSPNEHWLNNNVYDAPWRKRVRFKPGKELLEMVNEDVD